MANGTAYVADSSLDDFVAESRIDSPANAIEKVGTS